MKQNWVICICCILFLFSCKKEEPLDPNVAITIAGTYHYVQHIDQDQTLFTNSFDRVDLVRIDDTTVDIFIYGIVSSFSPTIYSDILVKREGSEIKLSSTKENLIISGSILENGTFNLDITQYAKYEQHFLFQK